jgi:mono/diheme cytochrome c family protein
VSFLVLLALVLTACSQKMRDQPKLGPDEPTNLFANGTSSQLPPADTQARGLLRDDTALFTGKDANGNDVTEFPFPITKDDILRGQERFNIYCAPCHARLGTGGGVVVANGFYTPPTFHDDRLRNAPVGHFFDVITNGLTTANASMPSYANQVPARDRWDIIAYIRVLQYSQHAPVNDLTPEDRQKVQAGG